MKKNNTTPVWGKTIMAIFVMAIINFLFTSCNKEEDDDLFQAKAGIKEEVERMVVLDNARVARKLFVSHHAAYLVSQDTITGVIDTAQMPWYPSATGEAKIWRETNIGLVMVDTLPRQIDPKSKTITVAYNNGVVNTLKIELGMTVMQAGQPVTVYLEGVELDGTWNQDVLQNTPFREESSTHYTLSSNGEEFLTVDQEFLMTEKLLVDDTIRHTVTDTIHNVVNDTVHHTVNDTTHTQVNDTTRVVVNDTVRVNDTVVVPTPGPAQRTLLYTDSVDRHVSVNTVGVVANGIVTWSCANERRFVNHYSAAPFVEDGNVVGYNKYFPYAIQATGVATTAMEGLQVPVMVGVADFGGFTVVVTPQATYADVANPLGCTMTVNAVEINNSTLIFHGTLDGTPVTAEQGIVLTPTNNPIQIPEVDFNGEVMFAQVVTMYTTTAATSGVDVLHVIVENNGTYTWYYATWRSGLTVSDFYSQAITATQYNYLVDNITSVGNNGDGIFLSIADHNMPNTNSTLGTVYSRWTGSKLRLEYRNMSVVTYYMMDFSMTTVTGLNPNCPLKAMRDSSGKVTYGGYTYRVN